ncbi:substrate-binding periplasmic protein [Rhizobium sp. C4]|uniref:substrate-binding periplasmic protein n=1 Tax=Rhizobium sp. C4 TaxID=1349800 RepID=UPI001E53C14C|nr:transporter substrate-binding domain-containing protein [Rhizobium sp. C4]MCD2173714.1 transporter substrate-binding domain-containing protein [Rhizobium sp. C4]
MTKARLARNGNRKAGWLASLACMASLWSASASAAPAETLHLLTESYPPYSYQENGVLKGIAIDLMKAIMTDAGIPYEMKIQPWARAYGLALNSGGHCVFSTVHTAERDALFEWIEPLFTTETYLVRRSGSDVKPTDLDDAKRYLVGTQLGDYTEALLKQGGFRRVDLTSEIDLSLKKLIAGRIDLMPMAASMVTDLQKQAVPVEPAVVLTRTVDSLACNKSTSPETLERIRASLKKLIDDGTRAGIFERYQFVEGGLLHK